jgi:hypothetical protein
LTTADCKETDLKAFIIEATSWAWTVFILVLVCSRIMCGMVLGACEIFSGNRKGLAITTKGAKMKRGDQS